MQRFVRKTIAIVLLTVQFYNLGGYVALFKYFIYRADKFNEQQISKDRYKEADLVEVKIPVHLPVLGNWIGYQTISGSVQLEQNSYNYVRMKVTQDTLYVMCIPNYKTTRLNKANIIFAREVSEAPFNAKKQNLPVKSIMLLKYMATQTIIAVLPPVLIITPPAGRLHAKTISSYVDVAGQPPNGITA